MEELLVHVGVLWLVPDPSQLLALEASLVILHQLVVEDAIDRVGPPPRLEDNEVLEDRIVLEVEHNAEIVQVLAELELVLTLFETMLSADVEVLIERDVV